MASFWKSEACGQTVLPDRSVLIGQNRWKIPKFQNSNATFWVIFKQRVNLDGVGQKCLRFHEPKAKNLDIYQRKMYSKVPDSNYRVALKR